MYRFSGKKITTFLFLMVVSSVFAGNITFNNMATGTSIAAGTSLVMQDQEFYKLQVPGMQNFTDYNLTNLVKLSYRGTDKNAATMATYSGLWTLTVNYNIRFYNNNNVLVNTLSNQVLVINHSSAGISKDIDVQKITGVQARYKFDVQINSVTSSAGMPSPLSNDIHFETEINTDRYYTLVKPSTAYAAPGLKGKDPSSGIFQPITVSSINSSTGTKYYELEFSWPFITGAEEYELEWVYSFYDLSLNGSPSSVPVPDFSKAARITTPENAYRINLLYEQGYIYYRYRPVSKKLNDLSQILQGDWSAYGNILIETPHDATSNWSYGAVYAEDGKKKEVASYFDFSLRKRETVTRNNSNNTSLVSETMYDFEGRPTINVLPTVPQTSNDIKYYSNYSLSGTLPFDKKAFSSLQARLAAQKYANLDGGDAGAYYKSKTENMSENYLPDAENVPYTQTVYNADGMVQAQTGLGRNHALGSGHESKFFYASPSQYKLDKLFGNEVGFDKFYKLQVSKDANGQVSYTYLNLQNKPIATSLVNDPASENGRTLLEPLSSNGQAAVTDLWDGTETFNASTESWENKKPFFVSVAGTYNFNVSIGNTAFSHCSGSHDCLYDLQMTFTDPCGNVITENTPSSPSVLNTLQTFNVSSGTQVYTFAITFPDAGTYMFTKTLRLNQSYLDQQVEDFKKAISNNTSGCTIPSLARIAAGLSNGTDISGCTDCADPAAPCPDVFDCGSLLDLLKKDFKPAGQYAQNMPLTGVTPGNCWLKTWVWDDCNIPLEPLQCLSNPVWMNAAFRNTYGALITNWSDYKTNFDNGYLVQKLITSANDPGPATTNPACVYTPAPLVSVTNYDAVKFESLIEFHPEYCHYEWCEVTNPSTTFDASLQAMNVAVAQNSTNQFLSTTTPYSINITNLLAKDPFFHSNVSPLVFTAPWSVAAKQVSISAGEISAMTSMMSGGYYDASSNIISMWKQAVYVVNGNPNATTLTAYELKNAWKTFVSYYLYEKLKMTEAYKVNTFGCPYLYDGNADGYADAPPTAVFSSASTKIQELYLKAQGFKIRKIAPQFPTLATGPAGGNASLQQFSETVCGYNESSNCEALASYAVGLSSISFANGDYVKIQCVLPTACGSVLVDVTDNTSTGVLISSAATAWSTIATSINSYLSPSLQQAYTCATTAPGSLKVVACLDAANNRIVFYPTSGFGADFNGAVIKLYKNGTLQTTTPSSSFNGGFLNTTTAPCVDNTDDLNCFCAQIGDLRDEYNADATLQSQYANYTDYIVASLNTDYNLTGSSQVTVTNVNTWLSNCYTSKTTPNILYEDAENWPGQTPESVSGYDSNENTIQLTNTVPKDMRCYEFSDPCAQNAATINDYYSSYLYSQLVNTAVASFLSDFKAHCLGQSAPIDLTQHTTATYTDNEYHYTLYYYDQAGNLTRTVPPKAVVRLSDIQVGAAQSYRILGTGTPVLPDHAGKNLNNLGATASALTRNYNTTVAGTNTSDDPNVDLCASQRFNPLVTSYIYNSYNQIIAQTTPDAGTTTFWYDKKGKITLSQNEEQFNKTNQEYSYTLYDNLTRITEVGKLSLNPAAPSFEAKFSFYASDNFYPYNNVASYRNYLMNFVPTANVSSVVADANTTISEITRTYYDNNAVAAGELALGYFIKGDQLNTRNRVTATERFASRAPTTKEHSTFYSYDEHGNVSELVQKNILMTVDYGNLAIKKIAYDYDLISGKVNKVTYQPNELDQYIHKYSYDAENRLTTVYTSKDGIIWDRDADYFYYKHGPLARTEVGDKKVQGIDYAYTIQGWIKGVNAGLMASSRDQGRDGFIQTNTNFSYHNTYQAMHQNTGQDAFGYSLQYFDGDYKPVSDAKYAASADRSGYYFLSAMPSGGTVYRSKMQNLYNGNISSMVTSIYNSNTLSTPKPLLAAYSYDQLNRLVKQNMFTDAVNSLSTGNNWTGTSTNSDEYKMELSYDALGNITHLKRNGVTTAGHVEMDDLNYSYNQLGASGCIRSGSSMSTAFNTLQYATNTSAYSQNQSFVSQTANNYQYDKIGNMTSDAQEGISAITWDVYGKIKTITYTAGFNRAGSYPPNLQFIYDASGQRVCKIKIPRTASGPEADKNKWIYDYYVRDAQGNIMAVYQSQYNINDAVKHLALIQRDVFGSSRLGTDMRAVPEDNNALMINNSSFATNAGNWATNSIVTYDAAGQRLKVQTATQYNGADLIFTTVPGKTYDISYQFDKSANMADNLYAEVYDVATTTWVGVPQQSLHGSNYMSFTAKGTQSWLRIIKASATGTSLYYIDNVFVKLAENNRLCGNKNYELSNHLGNVLSVVSDNKIAFDNGTYNASSGVFQNGTLDNKIDGYKPELLSATDYYAFGEAMPGRQYNNGSYRYGFNGKENDNSVHLDASGMPLVGSQQDYGMRIYNAALCRFLSVDPLTRGYPELTPYQFASNRPIDGIDLDGLEFMTIIRRYAYGQTKPVISKVWYNDKQHNEAGPKGEGLLIQNEMVDSKGKVIITQTMVYKNSIKGDHGFYCGPTQMPTVPEVVKYMLPSIDAVDEGGRVHDLSYDFVGATAENATKSWATIEADKRLIAAVSRVIVCYNAGLPDPYNHQKITDAERTAAVKVIGYFDYSKESKIDDVSDWMEKNYSDIAKKASGFFNDSESDQEYNYILFRDMYMYKGSIGIWKRKEGMWKQDASNTWVPKTPEELKKK